MIYIVFCFDKWNATNLYPKWPNKKTKILNQAYRICWANATLASNLSPCAEWRDLWHVWFINRTSLRQLSICLGSARVSIRRCLQVIGFRSSWVRRDDNLCNVLGKLCRTNAPFGVRAISCGVNWPIYIFFNDETNDWSLAKSLWHVV